MDKYVKVKGILVIWVLVIIHINLIFNLCTMISSISNKEFRASDLEQVLDDKLDKIKQFEEVNMIYSSCNHTWEKMDRSNAGYHITLSCSKCGTIQVVNITEEAIYINVGK